MILDHLLDILEKRPHQDTRDKEDKWFSSKVIKKVPDRTISYSQRFKGQWFKPDFNTENLIIAEHKDSYLFRSVKKKVDRFMLSGYEFVSENDEALTWIKQRISYMEVATNRPFSYLIESTVLSLLVQGNSLWIKTRDNDRSPGDIRYLSTGKELHPVAGYHIAPFERMWFKTKQNGEILSIKEVMPDGKFKEYDASELIHFFVNKDPGQVLGFPELIPAMDDIELLRSIEENVQELIETSLYPRYHFKVGNDKLPAVMTREGATEVDYVRDVVEYLPPGAVYVSDHRQEIEVFGAENKALRIDFYLNYFKARVFAAIGTSGLDMGEGGSANRSTASTLSKGVMMDIEALQVTMKRFLEFYVINELLQEGGFNPLDPAEQVSIRFGVVDKEERMAQENQVIQKFTNNLITRTLARKELGYPPLKEEESEDMFFKLVSEPLALIAAGGPGTAASETLGAMKSSSITPQAVNKEKNFATQTERAKAAPKAEKTNGTSANKSRPSNQYGARKSPKLTKDLSLTINGLDFSMSVPIDFEPNDQVLKDFKTRVLGRAALLLDSNISLQTIINNQVYTLLEDIND